MARCAGIRADGGRCGAQAMRNSQWCLSHDPNQADARRRRAAKGGKRGGRGRPAQELADVKRQLQDLADMVLVGEVERADASVAGQLLNIKLRALETERRWKELSELEERMVTLEATLAANKKESNRWGA
jgi:hypothetical protein